MGYVVVGCKNPPWWQVYCWVYNIRIHTKYVYRTCGPRPNFATDPTFREASCTTTVAKDMLQQVDIAYFTAVGVFRRPPRPELFGFNQRAKQEHRAEDAGKGTGVNQPCSSVQSRESSKTADSARAWSWGRGAGHLCKTGLVCKGVVLSAAKLLAKTKAVV